jgi:LmbE family N-acetylglucosaminyl deacetylase
MSKFTRRSLCTSLLGLPAAAQEKPGAKFKVVVVGAHPDDPETGCGGTMARYAALGYEVVALYLTRGETGIRGKGPEETAAIRTAEAEKACKILGARPVFAGQVNGSTEVNRERYEQFNAILAPEEPDIVFAHWPIDTHPDHRVASLMAYQAWQTARKKFQLYYFEVESGAQSQNFAPNTYVDISSVADKKRNACFAHESQNPDGFWVYHDAMQKFRGLECRTRQAEAFVRYAGTGSPALPLAN